MHTFSVPSRLCSLTQAVEYLEKGVACKYTATDAVKSLNQIFQQLPGRAVSNLTFSAEDESRMMQPLLDHKDAQVSARQWLKDHPQDLQRWLEGVTTADGKPAAGNLKLSAK